MNHGQAMVNENMSIPRLILEKESLEAAIWCRVSTAEKKEQPHERRYHMKPWVPILLSFSILCLLSTADVLAASGESTGPTRDTDRRMGTPLAEMMFYEAAEQAVEDGYARIIPESEEEGASEKTGEIKNKTKKTGPEAPVLESVEVAQ